MSLPKPFYIDDYCTIYHGDNSEILPYLTRSDMILTSPPYDGLRQYCGFSWDFDKLAKSLFANLAQGGVCVWVVGDQCVEGSESGSSFRQALAFKDIGFKLHDTMIYQKAGVVFPETTRYNQSFEYMFVFARGKPSVFNPITKKNKRAGQAISGGYRQPDGSVKVGVGEKKQQINKRRFDA